METLTCNDTIEYIMKTIDFLQKVKHVTPTTEKIYNPIRKKLNDNINNGMVEVRGKGDQESVFIIECTEESLEELGEKTISETNMQTEIQMAQKEDRNTEIRLGNVGIQYQSTND